MSARSVSRNQIVFLTCALFISTVLSACADSGKNSASPAQPQKSDKSQNGTESGAPADRELQGGLFPLDSEQVPDAVRARAGGIFEIWVPVAEFGRSIDISLGGTTKLKAKIQNSVSSQKEKIAILNQWKGCERQRGWLGWVGIAASDCLYSYEFVRATAFLAGDGQTLWTSFNVLNQGFGFTDSVVAVKQFSGSPSRIPFFVFNANGELVYDSYQNQTSLVYFPESADQKHFSALNAPENNFVALRLGQEIGEALPISQALPSERERLFSAGFSDCTGCGLKASVLEQRDRAPQPNADGDSIRFGIGVVRGTRVASAFKIQSDKIIRPGDDFTLIFSTADGNLAHKGGPALNARGEVVGLTSFVQSVEKDGQVLRMTTFVRPAQLTKLAR